MISIVVDTNVFVAAFLKGGKPLAVLQSAQEDQSDLLLTFPLHAEILQVIQRPKFSRHFAERGIDPVRLLEDYTRVAQMVVPTPITDNPLRDEKDLKVLECAVGGRADYIVTGDDDLLTLIRYRDTLIVTPAQFISILNRSGGA